MEEFLGVVSSLSTTWPDRAFIWRGVPDADWELHSSLYRRASKAEGQHLREGIPGQGGSTMVAHEQAILDEARRWGLQRTATDRLSTLELMAALQHQGVPTRLIDFTHNAILALWFAVQVRLDDAGEPHPEVDGRVFIVQSNARAITEEWARAPDLPWGTQTTVPTDWLRDIYVWTPPPIDPRMTRQQGCFAFGGVPTTAGGGNALVGGKSRPMRADEIRACVSIPVRLNKPVYLTQSTAQGREPGYPLAFTLRIVAEAKATMRRDLERGFGYTHAMLFPDYPGFNQFAKAIPRRVD